MYTRNSTILQEYRGEAGLYVKRGGEYTKITIGKDEIAFQIGECSELASSGLFKATEHLVKGMNEPGIER